MTTPSIARIGKGNNPGRHESRVLGEFFGYTGKGSARGKMPVALDEARGGSGCDTSWTPIRKAHGKRGLDPVEARSD